MSEQRHLPPPATSTEIILCAIVEELRLLNAQLATWNPAPVVSSIASIGEESVTSEQPAGGDEISGQEAPAEGIEPEIVELKEPVSATKRK